MIYKTIKINLKIAYANQKLIKPYKQILNKSKTYLNPKN